ANQGISFLQPVHQVAQKSSTTTLPRYLLSFTVLPELSFSTNSGAALRSAAGVRAARTPASSAAAARPATANSKAIVFMCILLSVAPIASPTGTVRGPAPPAQSAERPPDKMRPRKPRRWGTSRARCEGAAPGRTAPATRTAHPGTADSAAPL